MAEDKQTRRYPPNLQGVLRLAVDAGSAAEGHEPVEPMSEEVRGVLDVGRDPGASGRLAHLS